MKPDERNAMIANMLKDNLDKDIKAMLGVY